MCHKNLLILFPIASFEGEDFSEFSAIVRYGVRVGGQEEGRKVYPF